MATSTPRRIYNLRSAGRDDSPAIPFRKRVTCAPADECTSQKRQRTHQSVGPAFSSPDAMNHSKSIQMDDQRHVVSVLKRLSDCVAEKPFGKFGKLPTDAVFHIMSRMPYHNLGSMSMTSNSWMEAVYAYVESGSFRVRWLADIASCSWSESAKLSADPFYSLGLLVRRMTFTHCWEARLAFFRSFLKLAHEAGAPMAGLGRMIHAFTECSDSDVVLEKFDDVISMVFSVVDDLRDALNGVILRSDRDRQMFGREGLDVFLREMEIRKNTKALFLNNGSSDTAAGVNKYFLSSLMKVFKNIHGSLPTALFYMLFAPTAVHQGVEVIDWHRLAHVSVNSLEDAQELKPLSRALYALLRCRNLKNAVPWTKNTIFNLMEEVTTYPSPWSMNTFVSLQVLEPELVPIGVIARMHRNHEDEAGDMICTMKMLLHRWEMDVRGVMESVMENIKTGLKEPKQRRFLFDRVWDWHQKNIDEFRLRVGRFSDIRDEIESQIEFLPVLMKLL